MLQIVCPITGLSVADFCASNYPTIQKFNSPHPLLSLPPKRALSILLSVDNPPTSLALPLILNALTLTDRVSIEGSVSKGAETLGQGTIAALTALAERLAHAPPLALASLPRVIVRDCPTLIGLPTVFAAAFADYLSGTDKRLTAIAAHAETRTLDALASRLNARSSETR